MRDKIEIVIDEEFKGICKHIANEKKTEREWALIEACDMFQTEHYSGGYDATEHAFCFSYYDSSNKEYWLQIKIEEIERVINGDVLVITGYLVQ